MRLTVTLSLLDIGLWSISLEAVLVWSDWKHWRWNGDTHSTWELGRHQSTEVGEVRCVQLRHHAVGDIQRKKTILQRYFIFMFFYLFVSSRFTRGWLVPGPQSLFPPFTLFVLCVGSGNCIIGLIRFLARRHKRCLNQALVSIALARHILVVLLLHDCLCF